RRHGVGEPALAELADLGGTEARHRAPHGGQPAPERAGAEHHASPPEVAMHLVVGRDAAEGIEDQETATREPRHEAELGGASALAASRLHPGGARATREARDAVRGTRQTA